MSKSAVNAGFPFTNRTASTLTSGCPTTEVEGTSEEGINLGMASEASGGESSGSTSTALTPSVIGLSIKGLNGSGSSPRRTAAACLTAATGFTYAVSRSRIPESMSRISISLGSGVSFNN